MKVSALNEGGHLAWVGRVTRFRLLLRIAESQTLATQTKTTIKAFEVGQRSGYALNQPKSRVQPVYATVYIHIAVW